MLELDIDRFRMADEDRHPHASGGELDLGVEDLLRLRHHLPFFLREAGVQELVDVRDHVEGDAFGKFLGLDRVGHEHCAGLREKLVHGFLAGAGNRLIGRDNDTLDLGLVVQRL